MKNQIIAAAIAATAFTAAAFAAPLASDTFSYSDGDLTSVSAGVWENHSGTVELVQVSSGAAVLNQGGGSREDVNIDLSATQGAGDVFYAGFDVTVTGGSDTVYFAHFKDSGTGFNARTFITAPTAGGDFSFAIDETSSSSPTGISALDFSFGTTYRVVTSYSFDSGLGQLFVAVDDGTTVPVLVASDTGADIGQPMQQFALRQATGNSSQVIDNLIVATTFAEAAGVGVIPEPATLGLLGVAGLGLMRRRTA